MDASALASAESWLSIIGAAKLVAAFLVAIGVAIEFGGDWVAKPFEKVIEDARKSELTELHKQSDEAKLETARLSADAESSRAVVAEANVRAALAFKDAAEARERTAQIEKLTAWRRVSAEQLRQISDAIRGEMTSDLNVRIEWERSDPESFSYAFDLHKIFIDAGVEKVSGEGNSWIGWQKFGLYVAASPAVNLSPIKEAFEKADIHLNDGNTPSGFPTTAGIYIFVAPKTPLHFEEFSNTSTPAPADAAQEATPNK